MNASFGRHSGRGTRREEFYQFKRQDSNDSSKLQERLRRSQEGLRNATNSEGPSRKGAQSRRRDGAQNSDYDGQSQAQFGQRHKSVAPTRSKGQMLSGTKSNENNSSGFNYKEMLNKKYSQQGGSAANPLGIVMGPPGGKD